MFKQIHFTPLPTKWAHFKFDACYRSKKSWHRGKKRQARNVEKIQLGEHIATNYINWHQDCNMISYKRDFLERQSLSEVKMGRGSPICERVRKKIVEYFKNNVKLKRFCKSHHLQCITSSKDSEKLEISVRKGQGWRPLLDARGLRALRWLIGMILSLTLLNGPRNTTRNHCQ